MPPGRVSYWRGVRTTSLIHARVFSSSGPASLVCFAARSALIFCRTIRPSPANTAADLDGGPAPHPCVHLVEDERRHRVRAGQHDLEGQHHAGQLTSGGAARERSSRCAVMRAEQQLHLVDTEPPERDPAPVGQQQA